MCYFLLTFLVSDEKSFRLFPCRWCIVSLELIFCIFVCLKISNVWLWCVLLCISLGLLCLRTQIRESLVLCFSPNWENFSLYYFWYFFPAPHYFSSNCALMTHILCHFLLSHGSLGLREFYFQTVFSPLLTLRSFSCALYKSLIHHLRMLNSCIQWVFKIFKLYLQFCNFYLFLFDVLYFFAVIFYFFFSFVSRGFIISYWRILWWLL